MTRPSPEALRELLGGGGRGPASLLGEQHPLVRALDLLAVLVRQSLVVAGVTIASAIALVEGVPRAAPFLAAAAVVQVALGVGIALLVQVKRERARELIIEGRDGLPVRSVAAERSRLLDPRERRRLARSLEQTLSAAENWERLAVASRPPPDVRRLRAFAPELRELASALRAGELGIRGVGLVARLLAGGYGSPLYGARADELRSELARIRRHLSRGSEPGTRSQAMVRRGSSD